jgi:ATP/maltotriose-dependent transcriptional regulator MalT
MIATKLFVPHLRRGLVARPRLRERLRRGAESKLTLVSAPVGFGKTTLLAEWLGERASENRRVAWLSLDAADADPTSFWTYVTAPHTAVVNDLASAPADVWLVLDDCGDQHPRRPRPAIAYSSPGSPATTATSSTTSSRKCWRINPTRSGNSCCTRRCSTGSVSRCVTRSPAATGRARADELRTSPATIAVFRASLAQARGDVEGTAAHARRAFDLAGPTDHLSRSGAAGFLALAAWARGDVSSALETFSEAVVSMHAAGALIDELSGTVLLADMWLAAGRPSRARRLYRDALRVAEAHGGAVAPATAALHVGISEIDREVGEFANAHGHLKRAGALSERAAMNESRYRWFAAMGRLGSGSAREISPGPPTGHVIEACRPRTRPVICASSTISAIRGCSLRSTGQPAKLACSTRASVCWIGWPRPPRSRAGQGISWRSGCFGRWHTTPADIGQRPSRR